MENLNQARFNMIHQQIRPYDVTDNTILDLMSQLPRQYFVPAHFQSVAHADIAIPLKDGHKMLQPKIVARALQALKIQKHEHVLEIGSNTGYVTALLSQLANQVFSTEIDKQLFEVAQKNLCDGYSNVTLAHHDGALGWEQHAPYPVIFVNGSYPVELPAQLIEQMIVQGRCFAIIGKGPAMKATLFTKTNLGLEREVLFETQSPPLINAPKFPDFIF